MERLSVHPSFRAATINESAELGHFLLEQYGFQLQPDTLESARETVSSEVFRGLDVDGVGFLVKVSRWFQPDAQGGYAGVRDWLELLYGAMVDLDQAGVSLNVPRPTRHGSWVTLFRGAPTVVLPLVEGSMMPFTPEGFAMVGAALGRFHRLGRAWLAADRDRADNFCAHARLEGAYEETRPLVPRLQDQLLEPHAACSAPDVCASLRASWPLIQSAMQRVDMSGVQAPDRVSGLLHNDLHAGNVFIKEATQTVTCIDLDQAGVGPCIWDIGNTLASFATHLYRYEMRAEIESMAGHFLAAYHLEHPLPLSEYLLIPDASIRWDVLRILRGMRRHYEEGDRLPALLGKIPTRFLPRLSWVPVEFAFLTPAWITAKLGT